MGISTWTIGLLMLLCFHYIKLYTKPWFVQGHIDNNECIQFKSFVYDIHSIHHLLGYSIVFSINPLQPNPNNQPNKIIVYRHTHIYIYIYIIYFNKMLLMALITSKKILIKYGRYLERFIKVYLYETETVMVT